MTPLPSKTVDLVARQIWAIASATSSATANACYEYKLRPGGSLVLNNRTIIPFSENAFLRPDCGADDDPTLTRELLGDSILEARDPWFSSTAPVLFVLGICLTVAWVLLIMLLITPRTFFQAGMGYGMGQMRTSSAGGNSSIPIVGIGNRPWFQKVATFTVAVSLLLAACNTFGVAANQYDSGVQDSLSLTNKTLNSTEVRIIRFISSTFEWLAQAQTALRLFQRHRERVVIKWVALSLIGLEMVFGILYSFTSLGKDDEDFTKGRPRRYASAIPAIKYLFEMALSLMYAAVVLYYSLTKRRYAYYHQKMKNISLVALIAIIAILVPVVFFILDISQPAIASWGDYVRWVGAAAASVLVWEWVERIEALERDERKDGILGREIFEGDEMLDNEHSMDGNRGRRRKLDKTLSSSTTVVASSRDSGASGPGSPKRRTSDHLHQRAKFPRLGISALAKIAALRQAKKASSNQEAAGMERRNSQGAAIELQTPRAAVQRRPRDPAAAAGEPRRNNAHNEVDGNNHSNNNNTTTAIEPPQMSPSPVSRSDCTSASTVYRVVHHPVSPTSTPGISDTLYPQGNVMNVGSPSPDATKMKKRKAVNMSNLNPFRRRQLSSTPGTLESESMPGSQNGDATDGAAVTSASRDEAETVERLEKPGRSGFFSRFRRDPSEERELPPLVIPWRGDDAEASPHDYDLEAGFGGYSLHGDNDDDDRVTNASGHQMQRGGSRQTVPDRHNSESRNDQQDDSRRPTMPPASRSMSNTGDRPARSTSALHRSDQHSSNDTRPS